jgi:2'-5' RNA ligase
MRLFTGLSIPSNVSSAIESALAELRPLAHLRWSPVGNLHITLKFIGEWPEARLPEIEGALAAQAAPEQFPVTVSRFGYLPNPHRPKIFLAGVQGGASLPRLAELTDLALAPLGIKREERPYTPHLTLARIANENISGLRERIAALPAPDFGSFEVHEYHLYMSRQSPAGSVYSPLSTYSLPKAAS